MLVQYIWTASLDVRAIGECAYKHFPVTIIPELDYRIVFQDAFLNSNITIRHCPGPSPI